MMVTCFGLTRHRVRTWFNLGVCVLLIVNALAHPWGGLVVDAEGTIYFTFVSPMVGDDHYACVWKVSKGGAPEVVIRSQFSPSDMILAQSADRKIYVAERSTDEGHHQACLWQILPSENKLMIRPTEKEMEFYIQALAISDLGDVYFAKDHELNIRSPSTEVQKIFLDHRDDRIDDLAWGTRGQLYILSEDKIKVRDNDGIVTILTEGLKKKNPPQLPFPGANVLFDLAVDPHGHVFVAYYGNKSVLEITAAGEVTELLSCAPWTPHGIDVFAGEIFILESLSRKKSNGKFWRNEIIPRVRKIKADGTVEIIYQYDSKWNR